LALMSDVDLPALMCGAQVASKIDLVVDTARLRYRKQEPLDKLTPRA
jgi:hypothetical protein